MAKTKNYYYVLVFTSSGPVYVTSLDYSNKYAHWDRTLPPVSMSRSDAESLVLGLNLNFNPCVLVHTWFEILDQPYLYQHGFFEWRCNDVD